jgi:hypothetical protein
MNYDTIPTPPTNTSSTGVLWGSTTEGTHTITTATSHNATACTFPSPPPGTPNPYTLHVMHCKPEWYTYLDPAKNLRAPSSGPITIRIPSINYEDARAAATAAAAAWSAALNRSITVEAGYGTCDAGNPLCIGFSNDYGTLPDDPPGCAGFQGSSPNASTGVWLGAGTVRLLPKRSGDATRFQRTVAHELGHYFGLWNELNATCNYKNSLMATPPPGNNGCSSTDAPPADTALGPTPSNTSALLNSTYAAVQNRNICGW